MEDVLASFSLGAGRSVHVAPLSRQTIREAEADHLGYDGFYLFETDDNCETQGLEVLAKVVSLDAAYRFIELWQEGTSDNPK